MAITFESVNKSNNDNFHVKPFVHSVIRGGGGGYSKFLRYVRCPTSKCACVMHCSDLPIVYKNQAKFLSNSEKWR